MFVFGYRTVEKYKKIHTRAYVHLAPGTFELRKYKEILSYQYFATFEKNCYSQNLLKPLDQFV